MSDERRTRVDLYRHCLGPEIALIDALRLVGGLADGIALVYTPVRCALARVEGERLVDHDRRMVGTDAFEARVFNEQWELRWLQTRMEGAVRLGRAVLVGEARPEGSGAQPEAVEWLEREYILWGQGDGVAKDGWSRLSLARIGPLWAPSRDNIREKELAVLTAREYIARHDTGNAYIADERLTGLRRRQGGDANA